jgi:hypothetical protein
MDELAGSSSNRERIEITRSMISQGQTFRVHLEHVDDGTVAVDLKIGDDDRIVGHLHGKLLVTDIVPASAKRVVAAGQDRAAGPDTYGDLALLDDLCGAFVLVDQPAEDRSSPYPTLLVKIDDGGRWAWR